MNLEENSVFYATEGKDAQTINRMQAYLDAKGCPKEQMEQVSIDLSPVFIEGTLKNSPISAITFDRFHVKKLLNNAMNKIRMAEHKELKGKKYLFLKSNAKLIKKIKTRKGKVYFALSHIGRDLRLKVLFDDF